MLLHLSIINFIIFEKIFMDFTEGFNVFTGETGAGKSMIIDSIHLLLGGKSSKDFVRKGCHKTTVQGSFSIEPHSTLTKILENHQIELEEGTLIITRDIFDNGRSLAKINDTLVNLSFLKSISKYLLDIHGQYDQQSILDSNEHIIILDKMCGETLNETLNHYQHLYQEYTSKKSEVSKLLEMNKERSSRVDYLKFQVDEIDNAALKPNEETALFSEFNILSNINDIRLHLSNAAMLMNDGEHSMNELLSEGLKSVKKVSHIDSAIKAFENDLELMIDHAQELAYRLLSYIDEREVDDERLAFLDERLELINRFKRKYHMEVDEILSFREKAAQELNALNHIEDTLSKLRSELDHLSQQMDGCADTLHHLRIKKAVDIETAIISQLHSLNMKEANFKIDIALENAFNVYGKDQVHFLISTNLGVELMPLEKILSGGEVSRIMLAIKSIINEIDEVPTMIFDEIDTGISGKTAHLVGEKIKLLSNRHQVICVTHSPQIASAADTHFKIEKLSDRDATYSLITQLTLEERVKEVARLLSGREITENSIKNAAEMIGLAYN